MAIETCYKVYRLDALGIERSLVFVDTVVAQEFAKKHNGQVVPVKIDTATGKIVK